MILMTDGIGSYSDTITTRAAAEGIVIYTVGLGSGIDEALLRRIADRYRRPLLLRAERRGSGRRVRRRSAK